MVLEITDADALTGTALESIAAEFAASGAAAAEPAGPAAAESGEERLHAESNVRADGAEAIASLVDPFDLVSEVPGVELAQASWSSETIDYDPEAEDWTGGEDDGDGYYEIDDNETDDDGAQR
ncbi:hypothetical protein NKH18_32355 [Streptomyces sp. M10(2022)]